MDIWDRLTYFKKEEPWGDPARVNGLLLILLDTIRGIMVSPFVIHCAFEARGTPSEHTKGNAVDFHVTGLAPKIAAMKLLECFNDLHVIDHVGFGVYPDWNNPGFHLDVRGYRARWGRINGVYGGFDNALKLM